MAQQPIITRIDILDTINRLEARIQGLTELTQKRIQEIHENSPQNDIITFKNKTFSSYFNALFREHCLQFTFIITLFQMSVYLIIEVFPMNQTIFCIILGILLLIDIVVLIPMLIVSVEQILRLINRSAKLKTMASLYLSLVFTYALIYTNCELISPGNFQGVLSQYYNGVIKPVQLFIDFLYFSNVCQASVGFGDISPLSGYGRFTAFTQSIASVGFLSVLFSNWIS